jgi:hypothetical protein
VVTDPLCAESNLLRKVGDDHGVASPVRLERTVATALRPRREVDGQAIRFEDP